MSGNEKDKNDARKGQPGGSARVKYADIIDQPRHRSKKRAPMPVSKRAAQFAPFAALTGYEQLIEEANREADEE